MLQCGLSTSFIHVICGSTVAAQHIEPHAIDAPIGRKLITNKNQTNCDKIKKSDAVDLKDLYEIKSDANMSLVRRLKTFYLIFRAKNRHVEPNVKFGHGIHCVFLQNNVQGREIELYSEFLMIMSCLFRAVRNDQLWQYSASNEI